MKRNLNERGSEMITAAELNSHFRNQFFVTVDDYRTGKFQQSKDFRYIGHAINYAKRNDGGSKSACVKLFVRGMDRYTDGLYYVEETDKKGEYTLGWISR